MTPQDYADSILSDVGLPPSYTSVSLEALLIAGSSLLRKVSMNVKTVLQSPELSQKEALLLALSVAINEKHTTLVLSLTALAHNSGASDAEIAEIHACVSDMVVNNVFYRFRHFMHDQPYYQSKPIGLRLTGAINPVSGKNLIELVSIAVSSLNGCELCIRDHEESARKLGAEESRIFETVRLTSVFRSLCIIL